MTRSELSPAVAKKAFTAKPAKAKAKESEVVKSLPRIIALQDESYGASAGSLAWELRDDEREEIYRNEGPYDEWGKKSYSEVLKGKYWGVIDGP